MAMSTHIIGIKSKDKKWEAMKKVWDACKDAGVDPPETVARFFDYDEPDPYGEVVFLKGLDCCKEWRDGNSREGFEIDLTNLPENVVHIRFYNSW